jgi:hypothetical protein
LYQPVILTVFRNNSPAIVPGCVFVQRFPA